MSEKKRSFEVGKTDESSSHGQSPIAIPNSNFLRPFFFPALFLWNLFWELPMRRELDKSRKEFNWGFWILALILAAFWLWRSGPEMSASEYPSLEETRVIKGKLVRMKNYRGARYSGGEPVGIDTGNEIVYAACSSKGSSCLDTPQWKAFEGQEARLWEWHGRLIQLEVKGQIVDRKSFDFLRTANTGSFVLVMVGGIIFIPLFVIWLIRLLYLYGKTALTETVSLFQKNSNQ